MKSLIPITLALSVNLIADDELQEPTDGQEIALLEPSLLPTQVTINDLEITPPTFTPKKSSSLAVSLSLVPGLGHAYLGDYKTAGALFGSFVGLIGGLYANAALKGPDAVTSLDVSSMTNLLSYNMYAAYRDVRSYNKYDGYSYKMPNDSFNDLAAAPFQWSVIKKPEVWGGVLTALVIGAGLTRIAREFHFSVDDYEPSSKSNFLLPLRAFPVGIGEECLFRGLLQSAYSEFLTPYGGIAASSLMFGAAHISNATYMSREDRKLYFAFSIPFITVSGAYFGWLAHKNNSLKECVAMHAWYDFTLFMMSAIAQSAAIRAPCFSISRSF